MYSSHNMKVSHFNWLLQMKTESTEIGKCNWIPRFTTLSWHISALSSWFASNNQGCATRNPNEHEQAQHESGSCASVEKSLCILQETKFVFRHNHWSRNTKEKAHLTRGGWHTRLLKRVQAKSRICSFVPGSWSPSCTQGNARISKPTANSIIMSASRNLGGGSREAVAFSRHAESHFSP